MEKIKKFNKNVSVVVLSPQYKKQIEFFIKKKILLLKKKIFFNNKTKIIM